MKRNYIKHSITKITLNISSAFCNQPNGTLDILDILILDYINKLTLYCKPSDNGDVHYCNDGKFNYSELSFPEFCEVYNCIEHSGLDSIKFFMKVDRLVELGLVRMFSDNPLSYDCYRTTGLYDDYVI